MKLSELEDYWNMNHQRIEDELKKGIYQPGIIYNYEIINPRGKKRVISSLNVIDLESKDYLWVRFADNINIYTKTQEEAVNVYHEICKVLEERFKTPVNEKKSGVFRTCDRRFLGYEFYKTHGRTELRKYQYKKMNTYSNWHQSVVQKVNREYHITGNGVLTKRDYALLFENEEEKHHIPVEAMEQMNIYGDVTIHPAVLKTISHKKIRLAFVDQYGNVLGYFVPEGYRAASNVF